jgi:hypothetical protein
MSRLPSASAVFVAILFALAPSVGSRAAAATVENAGYRLDVTETGGGVNAALFDKTLNLPVAEGPYVYRAGLQRFGMKVEGGREVRGTAEELARLTVTKITVDGDKLTIRGELAGLDLEHTLTLPADRPIMEERIVLQNHGDGPIALTYFEAGFTQRVTDQAGEVRPEVADDRVVAIPFRHRATDPPGHFNDFSIRNLITQPGSESWVNKDQAVTNVPSRHRWSEGWALMHGDRTFCVSSFCQENMLFSILSTMADGATKSLRFGGAVMIQGEPAALTRIAPGQSVDLGITRFETVAGGYREAMYAYRKLLDEHGCRFPKDFNPPVHWEQLYDMNNAWNDRPRLYTKAIIDRQAAKGRDYSCEALYLDPGWDTALASFLWGEQWLGPRKLFIDEMWTKYGLKVSLHTPLASWMSHAAYSSTWGPSAVPGYPKEAWRISPVGDPRGRDRVPAVRGGRRNLALLPTAKTNVSSLIDDGKMPIHQTAHLNDGWFGNDASWVAAKLPAWAEIDLGTEHEISEIRVSNERLGRYTDRAPTELKVLAATTYNADSQAADWRVVAEYRGEPITKEKVITFPATTARWLRVDIPKTAGGDAPRLDEIEVYESKPAAQDAIVAFAKGIKRRQRPAPPPDPQMCLGSKQYLAEAEKRLLANCADGVVYLMFDGNWWPEGCDNPNHGHPVPYCKEDHIRANLDLCRRIHAKYPKVLIEMHDPLCGGNPWRLTPIYYKYGLPGSYDDNWGFELMWGPLDDIKQSRGLALYYSNMGCNVPIYTHVNLACDNDQCIVLWWYASTCRHLGIGGTHADPKIVRAQQQGMKWYRARDRFYKRGDFYGINEQIHLHVLPEEKAFTVNLFNLNNGKQTVSGQIDLKTLGLDPNLQYVSADGLGKVENGRFEVSAELPPWGTRVAEFRAKE